MKFPRISLAKTGKRISSLMKSNHLTVKDIQKEMGFEYPQAIYKWLRGESIPSLDNFVVLALLFNTTIDKILVLET